MNENIDDDKNRLEEAKKSMRDYLEHYPDLDALISEGKLRLAAPGWYEPKSTEISEQLGKYANGIRIKGGKVQLKLKRMNAKLKVLKDAL